MSCFFSQSGAFGVTLIYFTPSGIVDSLSLSIPQGGPSLPSVRCCAFSSRKTPKHFPSIYLAAASLLPINKVAPLYRVSVAVLFRPEKRLNIFHQFIWQPLRSCRLTRWPLSIECPLLCFFVPDRKSVV